jgi:hypothetical protein
MPYRKVNIPTDPVGTWHETADFLVTCEIKSCRKVNIPSDLVHTRYEASDLLGTFPTPFHMPWPAEKHGNHEYKYILGMDQVMQH